MDFVALHGRGLHSGGRCAVRLLRRPGPVAFVSDGREATLADLEIVRADRGVRIRAAQIGLEVDLVEHLLAAFAGVGVTSGVAIGVSGGEIPLLDGAALELSRALLSLVPPRARPALRVLRDGEIEIGDSYYELRRKDALEISVEIDFRARGLGVERARWGGSASDFLSAIAPARTFGFESEGETLRESGRAAWVDPEVVLVFGRDGRLLPGAAPPSAGELARHKLLDLLGDAYLFGGPPIGALFARRPGHSANHRALKTALARGLIGRT
jgi:UDP-3-O-[3-hydroxymyristoyl] N-acetylglucosamine deacetylase